MMSIANIKQPFSPLSIEDLFIRATVKSILDHRVSTSRLKNLIHSISNSSHELSLHSYGKVYEMSYFLSKTLGFQKSKQQDEKQCLIDHALDLATGKLSLSARKEIRNQYYGRDDILFPGEIVTDKKVKHFRDIKHLSGKVSNIENRINRYKQQQNNLRVSKDDFQKNLARRKTLEIYLTDLIAEINLVYKQMDHSSYVHHQKKWYLLNQLSDATKALHHLLKKKPR